MNNNKKGFTLVELLAVIVVLIIVMLIAISYIRRYTKSSKEKALNANAVSYVKAVNTLSTSIRGSSNEIKSGTYTTSDLEELGLSLSGTKPNSGFVIVNNYEANCACLNYNKSSVNFDGEDYQVKLKGNCTLESMVCKNKASELSEEYDFTGKTEVYVAPEDGPYKLEVWGAQGGKTTYNTTSIEGGYGAYAVGNIILKKGDVLYINVGDQGGGTTGNNNTGSSDSHTGYNGGGYGGVTPGNSSHSGGGGATSIAFKPGLLKNTDKIIIVAGGGGGSSVHSSYPNYSGQGGHAGGVKGNDGANNVNCYSYGLGASQNSAGGHSNCSRDGRTYGINDETIFTGESGFGYGANYSSFRISGTTGPYITDAGGGGGYYGGGSAWHSSGGGGSSYIGNELLTSKYMYCYNCTVSNDDATKTVSNTCVQDSPTANCSKKGNGYAKISYLGSGESDNKTEKNFYSEFKGYSKVEYILSHGNEYILTDLVPDQDYGFDVKFETLDNLSTSGYGTVFGVRVSAANRAFNLSSYGSTGTFTKANINYGAYMIADEVNHIKLVNDYYSNDESAGYYVNKTAFTAPYPLTIFAMNSNNTINEYGKVKLYDLYIYKSSDIIAHFIPCYNRKTNDIGLCELYSGKFYKNKGTGMFEKGDIIEE